MTSCFNKNSLFTPFFTTVRFVDKSDPTRISPMFSVCESYFSFRCFWAILVSKVFMSLDTHSDVNICTSYSKYILPRHLHPDSQFFFKYRKWWFVSMGSLHYFLKFCLCFIYFHTCFSISVKWGTAIELFFTKFLYISV